MVNEVIEIIKDEFSPLIEVTGDTAIKNDLHYVIVSLKSTKR